MTPDALVVIEHGAAQSMTPFLATVYPRALFRAHARHTTSGTLPEPLADDVPRGRPPTGADASWPVLGPLGTISNCFVLLGGGRPWSEPGWGSGGN